MMHRTLIKQLYQHNPALKIFQNNSIKYRFDVSQRFFSKQNNTSSALHIPPLPILEEMAQCAKANGFPSLKDTVIIGVQHILPTTASMFDVIINQFGIHPSDIFLAGKFYSSCPPTEHYMRQRGIHLMRNKIPRRPGQFEELMHDTVHDMWMLLAEHLKKTKKNKIIIFDEGAHCLESIPKWLSFECSFSSIEQTRFGLYGDSVGTQLFPLIDVACSSAKKRLESSLISQAIMRKIKNILPKLETNPNTVFGVIGNGAVGSAIVQHLLSLGYKVVIYDGSENAFNNIHHRNCLRVDKISSVIVGSNIIFGCTGRDITNGLNIFGLVKDEITLISTSSQDIEFKSLLKASDKIRFAKSENNTLSYLNLFSDSGAEIKILENGFPINFDRTAMSDPTDDMELTRGLLLGAFMQAVTVAKKPIDDGATLNKGSHLMLDPLVQQFVARRWLQKQKDDKQYQEKLDCFENIEWIKGNSNGIYVANELLSQSFGKEAQTNIPTLR
jgi:hypothetical protein